MEGLRRLLLAVLNLVAVSVHWESLFALERLGQRVPDTPYSLGVTRFKGLEFRVFGKFSLLKDCRKRTAQNP